MNQKQNITFGGEPISEAFSQAGALNFTPVRAGKFTVAKVVISGEELVIRPAELGSAILALAGTPVPGEKLAISVEYGLMTEAEFAALPDWH